MVRVPNSGLTPRMKSFLRGLRPRFALGWATIIVPALVVYAAVEAVTRSFENAAGHQPISLSRIRCSPVGSRGLRLQSGGAPRPRGGRTSRGWYSSLRIKRELGAKALHREPEQEDETYALRESGEAYKGPI